MADTKEHRGLWCSSSGFLDKNGNCRNPDGCACDAIERLERERDEARKECDKLASAWAANLSSKSETVTAIRARLAKMEDALRAIDAKVVDLGLAAQRKANGHKHEKFAAVRHSMRLIVSAALAEASQPLRDALADAPDRQ